MTTPISVKNVPSSNNNNNNNDTASTPSKKRRKRSLTQLVPAILSLILLAALVLSQSIFWATRENLPLLLVQEEQSWNTTTTTMTTTTTNGNHTVYKFHKDLVRDSLTTVVTAYFQIGSKYPSERYDNWMTNMLSTQDAMVIFTSQDYLSRMKKLRSHALNRTILICMNLSQVPLATHYPMEFWNHQLQINPERKRHKGYELFWIWLSKSWFITEAISGNWFHSTIFMWSDIGCYRNKQYNNAAITTFAKQLVPRHSILQMAHHSPNPPTDKFLWNNKLGEKRHFYHSGSQAIGYKDSWQTFHKEFENTLADYIAANKFVGDDQVISQSTCLRNPNACAYLPFDQVKDNHYFGLRYALHYGGNYTLWRPPGANVTLETISTTTTTTTR